MMTVEHYRAPPSRSDVITELHWVVTVTRPKMKHAKLQVRPVRWLRTKADHLVVSSEGTLVYEREQRNHWDTHPSFRHVGFLCLGRVAGAEIGSASRVSLSATEGSWSVAGK